MREPSGGHQRFATEKPPGNSSTSGAAPVHELVEAELRRHLSPIIATSLVQSACTRLGTRTSQLRGTDLPAILDHLERSLSYYLRPEEARGVLSGLRRLLTSGSMAGRRPSACELEIEEETDIRAARVTAIQIARAVQFDHPDATKVATVVSELARNILQYAGRGTLRIEPLFAPRGGVRILARDDGPGIAELDAILEGRYRSPHGLGLGLRGSRLIMDRFDIVSGPGLGTSITAVKYA